MSESTDLIERYLAAGDDVEAAFSGMTREQLLARPVAGKWSAMEVLCHLVDTDLMTAMRIRTALTSATPRMMALTTEQLTAQLAPEARDAAEEIAFFKLIRSQTARIVQALPDDALSRKVTLVKVGGQEVVKEVGTLLSGITGHVAHHLAFVSEKRKLLGV